MDYLGGVVEAAKAGECETRDGLAAAARIMDIEGWSTKAADPPGDKDDLVSKLESTLERFSGGSKVGGGGDNGPNSV